MATSASGLHHACPWSHWAEIFSLDAHNLTRPVEHHRTPVPHFRFHSRACRGLPLPHALHRRMSPDTQPRSKCSGVQPKRIACGHASHCGAFQSIRKTGLPCLSSRTAGLKASYHTGHARTHLQVPDHTAKQADASCESNTSWALRAIHMICRRSTTHTSPSRHNEVPAHN